LALRHVRLMLLGAGRHRRGGGYGRAPGRAGPGPGPGRAGSTPLIGRSVGPRRRPVWAPAGFPSRLQKQQQGQASFPLGRSCGR